MFVQKDDIIVNRQLHTGTPQRGTKSPACWNCNFDHALIIIESMDGDGTAFADDLVAALTGPDPFELVPPMQSILDKLVHWGSTCGLKFSHTKSKAILFHKSKSTPPNLPKLMINGHEIPYATEVKYLGMTFTQNLSWTPHIKDKIKSSKGMLVKIKRAINTHSRNNNNNNIINRKS